MTTSLNDGTGGYLLLLAICLFAHEPWRWLGYALGRNLRTDSEVFLWVRAVATALVAGLVAKLVVFPAGTLAAVPALVRLTALSGSVLVYFVSGRNLALGVGGGSFLLAAIEWIRSLP